MGNNEPFQLTVDTTKILESEKSYLLLVISELHQKLAHASAVIGALSDELSEKQNSQSEVS